MWLGFILNLDECSNKDPWLFKPGKPGKVPNKVTEAEHFYSMSLGTG